MDCSSWCLSNRRSSLGRRRRRRLVGRGGRWWRRRWWRGRLLPQGGDGYAWAAVCVCSWRGRNQWRRQHWRCFDLRHDAGERRNWRICWRPRKWRRWGHSNRRADQHDGTKRRRWRYVDWWRGWLSIIRRRRWHAWRRPIRQWWAACWWWCRSWWSIDWQWRQRRRRLDYHQVLSEGRTKQQRPVCRDRNLASSN